MIRRAEPLRYDALAAERTGMLAWTSIAAFCAADTGITILSDYFPAPSLGDLPQGSDLVLDGLLVGGNPDVDGSALLHDGPRMLSASHHMPVPESTDFWHSVNTKKRH